MGKGGGQEKRGEQREQRKANKAVRRVWGGEETEEGTWRQV